MELKSWSSVILDREHIMIGLSIDGYSGVNSGSVYFYQTVDLIYAHGFDD